MPFARDYGADYDFDFGPFTVMTSPLANLAHDIPVLGPVGVALTLQTTWQQILGVDITRRGIWFHNPGTINMRVAPANVSLQGAAGSILIYPQNDLYLFARDDITNVGCAWMGWCDSIGNQPGTILNFTSFNPSVPAPEPLARLTHRIPIPSPLGTGMLLGTSSTLVIGPNPVRRGIEIMNPGTAPLAVSPSNLTPSYGGAGSITVLPGESKLIMAKERSRIRVNCGFNAIASGGSNNPITILEYL